MEPVPVRCVIDCSKPPDDPDQVSYRKLTRVELAQRKRDRADAERRAVARGFVEMRGYRDALLRATDHLESDKPWAAWRQRLRDLPSNTGDPAATRWPKPPAVVSCLYSFRALWPRTDWSPLESKGT